MMMMMRIMILMVYRRGGVAWTWAGVRKAVMADGEGRREVVIIIIIIIIVIIIVIVIIIIITRPWPAFDRQGLGGSSG